MRDDNRRPVEICLRMEGPLIAHETLRHQSKTASFRSVWWITVVVNCVLLAWLHADSGKSTVQGLFM